MKKRLISLLCTLSVAATVCAQTMYVNAEETDEAVEQTEQTEEKAETVMKVTVNEDETDTAAKIKTLQGLNLLGISKKMTYENYVTALAGFLSEDPSSMGTAEQIARQTGMIEDEDSFKADAVVTTHDAIKFAVVTLGYKTSAEANGGFPSGYFSVASNLGLTKGISLSENGTLTQEIAANILYEMIDTVPMVSFYSGEDNKGYAVDSDTTLLSLNRKIYKIEGVMTANKYTSIYRAVGTGSDTAITIDEETFETKQGCNTDFLGKNVTAYVYDNKGDKTVVYLEGGKNTEIIIPSDCIDNIESDFSEIEYEVSEDKYREAKTAAVPRVVYNGVFYDEYTVSDLMPSIGEIALVDNNRDGKYEIIFVTSYQTMVVQSVDTSNEKIWNKYEFDGALDSVSLSGDDNVEAIITTVDGRGATLSEIKPDSVLSIAASKSGDILPVTVVISERAKLSGSVSAVNIDKQTISVDGNVYDYTDEFELYLENRGISINAGDGYVFWLDAFGNIVYAESDENVEYKLFYKAYEEDEYYHVIYMDTANEWHDTKLAKKVKYNGESTDAAAVFETLEQLDAQVMKIKVNSKDEIKTLEVAELTESYKKNTFTRTSEGSYTYRYNPNSLGMEIYIDDGAKLFVFPEGDKPSKSDYYVRGASGYFSSDKSYSGITVYDKDEYGFSSIFSIKETASMLTDNINKSLFIVTSVYKKVLDDEVLPVIKGNFGSYSNITLVGSKESSYDDISVGDVVNIGTDRQGRANVVKKVSSLNDFNSITPDNLYVTSTTVAGTVTDLDVANGRMKLDSGKSFRVSSTTNVQYYTTSRNKCEAGFASDLREGDKVLFRLAWGNVSDMVCVRAK